MVGGRRMTATTDRRLEGRAAMRLGTAPAMKPASLAHVPDAVYTRALAILGRQQQSGGTDLSLTKAIEIAKGEERQEKYSTNRAPSSGLRITERKERKI